VFVTLLIVSCSESDKVVDQIVDGEQRGAVLRQTDVKSNSLALNSETGLFESGEQFAVDLEYQDHANGDLLEEMNVYLAFNDNTDDDTDNSVAEKLITSIPASDFSEGDRGLPVYSYSLDGVDMLSELGMNSDMLGIGGDQFAVRFEVVLTDGRKFSNANNSGTITGSYFSSPFLNGVTVVCAPTVPTPGNWTFVTNDSYGDGWNGASLTIVIDGAEAGSIANVDGDNMQTYEFNVPEGTKTISIKYVSGAWDSEVSFTITSANGNEVVNVPADPLAGVELLDYCLGGL